MIAIATSEALNAHIWVANIAPAVYLNGTLLFIAGLAIVPASSFNNCNGVQTSNLAGDTRLANNFDHMADIFVSLGSLFG